MNLTVKQQIETVQLNLTTILIFCSNTLAFHSKPTLQPFIY